MNGMPGDVADGSITEDRRRRGGVFGDAGDAILRLKRSI
jgi:hypothetical protein